MLGQVQNFISRERCLEVFDTVTCLRCFSMPLQPRQTYLWSPASSHLLINDSHLLDLSTLECKHLDIGQIDGKSRPLAWTADGSMLVMLTSLAPNCQPAKWSGASPWGTGTAMLCDGTIAEIVVTEISPSVMVTLANGVSTFPLGMPAALRRHLVRGVDSSSELALCSAGYAFGTGFSSPCSRLQVQWYLDVRCMHLSHIALDFGTRSMQVSHLQLGSISAETSPFWNPAPAAWWIYALVGVHYDIWLIDGNCHRVMQHWPGKELLGDDVDSGQPTGNHPTWHHITWCESGTKLLLTSAKGCIVLDFSCSCD